MTPGKLFAHLPCPQLYLSYWQVLTRWQSHWAENLGQEATARVSCFLCSSEHRRTSGPLHKAGGRGGWSSKVSAKEPFFFLRWDNSEVGGLFLAVIGSGGNKTHVLTLLVDLTCWLLCTRLYWAAGLWEAPAAQVLIEDNPIQFKAQSKLFGFPFLPSRLSSLPTYTGTTTDLVSPSQQSKSCIHRKSLRATKSNDSQIFGLR